MELQRAVMRHCCSVIVVVPILQAKSAFQTAAESLHKAAALSLAAVASERQKQTRAEVPPDSPARIKKFM